MANQQRSIKKVATKPVKVAGTSKIPAYKQREADSVPIPAAGKKGEKGKWFPDEQPWQFTWKTNIC